MSELIDIYDLEWNFLKTQYKNDFYKEVKEEYKKTKKISKRIKRSTLILLNSDWKIYIQKRSPSKSENPDLHDKTCGGHVSSWDTFDITIIRECIEELGFPATVVPDKDFSKAIKTIDLNVIGILKKTEIHKNFLSLIKTKNNDTFELPLIIQTYFGYYDGTFKFTDWECSGIQLLSLEELKSKMKDRPKNFTKDLEFLIKNCKCIYP